MKRFTVVLSAVLILIGNNIFGQENNMDNVKKIISEVKAKYAPDKRISIYNVNVEEKEGKFVLSGETNIKKAKIELVEQMKKVNIKCYESIELLPAKSLGEKKYAVVNLSVANMRFAPEHAAEMATQTLLGTAVRVFNKQDGWYQIQTPDNYIGWVDNDGIKLMTLEEVNNWITAPKVIYLSEFGFVNSAPDKNSLRVTDIVMGDILKFIEKGEKFTKVEYPNGRIGYIENELCTDFTEWLNTTQPTHESIVNTAKKFIGMPYFWGGTSSKAMDCSGFSKTVYFINGVLLQRDASQQVNTGELVDTKDGFGNCQPGDLLFFGRKGSDEQKERVTHVAIYLGDNEFIHSAGEISIDSFDKTKSNYNEYRLNSFIRAKRIISSLDKDGVYMLKNVDIYKGVKFNEYE